MGHWLSVRFTTLLVASSGSAKFPRTVTGFPLLSSSRTSNWTPLYPHRYTLLGAILNALLPRTYSLIRRQSIHDSCTKFYSLPAFFHNIKFNSSWTGRRCCLSLVVTQTLLYSEQNHSNLFTLTLLFSNSTLVLLPFDGGTFWLPPASNSFPFNF